MDTASVIGEILNHADEQDLERISAAIKSRHGTLRQIRAAAVNKGASVTLSNLTPKALNGLAGTVETISGQRADVRLARAANASAATQNGYVLHGVPLGCCQVAS